LDPTANTWSGRGWRNGSGRRNFPAGFEEYFERLKHDKTGEEISILIDLISTNTTHFFRGPDHFQFLADSIRQRIESEHWDRTRHTVRIWSAACSTGEEPYSIAMTVDDILANYPDVSVKILATDISQTALANAKAGRYDTCKAESIPAEFRHKYLQSVSDGSVRQIMIVPRIRNLITFAHFNLIAESYPFKHGFDYIFCRNVMIYFDRQTQETIVKKMSRHIRPGGYLIVGHSESLNSVRHDLTYVKPTIHRK